MASREFRVFQLKCDADLRGSLLDMTDLLANISLDEGDKKGFKKYSKMSEQLVKDISNNYKEIGELACQTSAEIVSAYKVGAIGMTIVGIIVIIGMILKMRG